MIPTISRWLKGGKSPNGSASAPGGEDDTGIEIIRLNGIKIAVDPARMSSKMLHVMRNGSYESQEAHQIPVIVQPGERIVELGAGVGYISALCGVQKDVQELVVYEANPELIPLIERTHELNGVKAKVINAVVLPAKESDTVPFYIREDFWASSLSEGPFGYERVVNVPVVSFDDMLAEHRPTMLIVDIEGGEASLFKDVPLTGIKKVYIEVHQNILGRVGMKNLFEFFSSRDFHYDQWHSSHGVVLFSHILR